MGRCSSGSFPEILNDIVVLAVDQSYSQWTGVTRKEESNDDDDDDDVVRNSAQNRSNLIGVLSILSIMYGTILSTILAVLVYEKCKNPMRKVNSLLVTVRTMVIYFFPCLKCLPDSTSPTKGSSLSSNTTANNHARSK